MFVLSVGRKVPFTEYLYLKNGKIIKLFIMTDFSEETAENTIVWSIFKQIFFCICLYK